MSKFVIFANARSGSTSLAKTLSASKDVKMALEPFHPKYSEWNPDERNYSEYIVDEGTMDKALDEILSKHTALKVLKYQFPKKIYFHMLKRDDLKIINLARKGYIQGAVSVLVAEQTTVWQKEETGKSSSKIYENLKPIDMTRIREMVDYGKSLNRTYGTFLKENRKGDYINLFYESLFSKTEKENISTIKDICAFLEISLPPKAVINKYMTPSKSKINFEGLYKNIPNYKEIEEEFGEIS
ncbi:hypothetical protein ACFL13_00095 [Patescibacteria group bacterium]